jgi:hypothetical protein
MQRQNYQPEGLAKRVVDGHSVSHGLECLSFLLGFHGIRNPF